MAYTDNFVADLLPLVKDLASADGVQFSKTLFEKVFLASDITKKHTVVTGVRNGSLVPIISDVPNYESFPFIDASSCDTQECDLNSNYSAREWKLGLISCRIPICLRTFNDNFLIFWNSYRMLNPGEVTTKYLRTALLQYLVDKVKQNLEAAKWRVEYFADKASTSPLFNGFDGWFIQMQANPALVVPIAKNAGATYAAQKQTGQEVYDTLLAMEELYLQQDWSGTKPVTFKITKLQAMTLASYMNSLKDTACCDGVERLNPDNIQSKTFFYDKLAFHGIPLEVMPEWDAIINGTAELNGGGGTAARENPNRIILTSKDNLLIGTEERQQLSMLDVFYEKKDNKVYIDAEAYLGAAVPLNEYILAI